MINYRTPNIDEFVNGFIYQVFIGYTWLTVEYPKNGISYYQLQGAIDDKIVRVCNAKIYQKEDVKKGDIIYMTYSDNTPNTNEPLIVHRIIEDRNDWLVAKAEGSKIAIYFQDGEFILKSDI